MQAYENAHERGTCSSYLGQVRKDQLASLLGKIFFGYKELKELRRSRNKELDEMGQEYRVALPEGVVSAMCQWRTKFPCHRLFS